MATYCVSDIHGNADAFFALLKFLQFKDTDTLYVLGDVIDRGPDGISLLKTIMHTHNIKMLLGNHELMMLEYFNPSFATTNGSCSDPSAPIISETASLVSYHSIRQRWNRNHNKRTLTDFLSLSFEEQKQILVYLQKLPFHETVNVNGSSFYLVHGFPGTSLYEEVWNRPGNKETECLRPNQTVIIGHTPVVLLETSSEIEQAHYFSELEQCNNVMKIIHSKHGWIDIDCGISYSVPGRSLACLCLDNMAEIYITPNSNNQMKAIVCIPAGEGVIEHEVYLPESV